MLLTLPASCSIAQNLQHVFHSVYFCSQQWQLSPFFSSLCHTLTMRAECLRWWMIHRDRVWTLCCELLSSDSFFSRADSEKDDMPLCVCFPCGPIDPPTRSKATELQSDVKKLALSSKLKLCQKLTDMQRQAASCFPRLSPDINSLPG